MQPLAGCVVKVVSEDVVAGDAGIAARDFEPARALTSAAERLGAVVRARISKALTHVVVVQHQRQALKPALAALATQLRKVALRSAQLVALRAVRGLCAAAACPAAGVPFEHAPSMPVSQQNRCLSARREGAPLGPVHPRTVPA